MNINIQSFKRWIPLFVIALLIAAAWASGLMEMVNLETIKTQRGELLALVEAHPVLSVLGFISVYIAAVALSLPIATVLTLLGGFLFGRWLGTFAIVIGATFGATILFLIARSTLGNTLREKAGPLYDKVAVNMKDNAVGYMLFMRLVPLFPFFLVNIVPALFNIRLLPYMLTTLVGIIPGTFVYANVGRELGTIESLSDMVSSETLIAFSLLGLFALIPTLYKYFKNRKGTPTASLLVVGVALSLLSFPHNSSAQNYPLIKQDVTHHEYFLALYDELLHAYTSPSEKDGVSYNGVDYKSWSDDPRHKEALNLLLSENPGDYKGEALKAFWINTYNFLTIDLIVREGERKTIKSLGSRFKSPWKKHQWSLSGQAYTLDFIEHKILRPMEDARIHFAINCASVSCPDLRQEPYRAEHLEKQLEEQVRLTLENRGKGVAQEEGKLKVSKIFNWFSEDFNKGDIKAWLNNYISLSNDIKIIYMDYDWSLNLMTQQGSKE